VVQAALKRVFLSLDVKIDNLRRKETDRNMKRLLILLLIMPLSYTLWAQEIKEDKGKYWFVSVNLAGSVFYGNEEKDRGFSKSPFKGFRNNLGISLAVGNWFSPEIALRTKINGFGGKHIISEDSEKNAMRYFVLNEQVMLDLTNIIGGYNPKRKYNLIPFFGGGMGRNLTYDRWATNLSVGILNQFRLTDRFSLNAELGFTLHTYEFSGNMKTSSFSGHTIENEDRQYLLEVGLTYKFK